MSRPCASNTWWSISEVAKHFDLTYKHVRDLCKCGKIKSVDMSTCGKNAAYRIHESEVRRLETLWLTPTTSERTDSHRINWLERFLRANGSLRFIGSRHGYSALGPRMPLRDRVNNLRTLMDDMMDREP